MEILFEQTSESNGFSFSFLIEKINSYFCHQHNKNPSLRLFWTSLFQSLRFLVIQLSNSWIQSELFEEQWESLRRRLVAKFKLHGYYWIQSSIRIVFSNMFESINQFFLTFYYKLEFFYDQIGNKTTDTKSESSTLEHWSLELHGTHQGLIFWISTLLLQHLLFIDDILRWGHRISSRGVVL